MVEGVSGTGRAFLLCRRPRNSHFAQRFAKKILRIRGFSPLQSVKRQEAKAPPSVKISVSEGGQAVCVARVESARPNSITSPIGSTMHLLSAGSAGILLMASASEPELRHILRKCTPEQQGEIVEETALARREGIARSYGRHHSSIYAVSVPVDLGETAAFTLVGWPEDFASPRQDEGRRGAVEKTARCPNVLKEKSRAAGAASRARRES